MKESPQGNRYRGGNNILMSSKMNHPKYIVSPSVVWIIKFVDLKSTNLTTNIFCRFQIDSDFKINRR